MRQISFDRGRGVGVCGGSGRGCATLPTMPRRSPRRPSPPSALPLPRCRPKAHAMRIFSTRGFVATLPDPVIPQCGRRGGVES